MYEHTKKNILIFLEKCTEILFSVRKNPNLIDCQNIYYSLIVGIDHALAQHIAHLFIRDPVSLFSEKINQDDSQDTDHFEVSHFSNSNYYFSK